jgi:transposase
MFPASEVVPKRWIVERTLAWISHFRRLARDFERYARSVVAFVRLAMIRIMLRRLTWISQTRGVHRG